MCDSKQSNGNTDPKTSRGVLRAETRLITTGSPQASGYGIAWYLAEGAEVGGGEEGGGGAAGFQREFQ